MPPKAKVAAPIDRPLSRAYLREFSGWSTAFPPGLSEPTSLRVMENMMVNRDGSLRIRPGMRYLSYAQAPFGKYVPGPPPGDPTFVAGNYTLDSGNLALPAGTQVGDLLVFAVFSMTPTIPADSRLQLIDTRAYGTQSVAFYMGHADNLNAISGITMTGQDCVASVTVYRGPPGVELNYVPSQLVVTPQSFSTTQTFSGPQLENLSGAICVYFSQDGIGGVYGDQDWTKAPAYSLSTAYDSAYKEIDVAITTTVPVPDQVTPHIEAASDHGWMCYVIGIRLGPDPDDPTTNSIEEGYAFDLPFVGTHEPFYLADGTKAYLCAVREADGTVGFRVMVVNVNASTMYDIEHPLIDFEVRQPREVLNFSADTTYVKYLQIDNKIFALSDNGEPMRVFKVGVHKEAKALAEISRPDWTTEDKLDVVHPDASWILDREPIDERRNRVHNPSFETNGKHWDVGSRTLKSRPQAPPFPAVSGSRLLRLQSTPERTNLAMSPLHNVASTGIGGWDEGEGNPTLSADGSYLKVQLPATKGLCFAHSRRYPGVEGGVKYQVAFDYDEGAHVDMKCRVQFFGVNGAQVGYTTVHELSGSGRFASAAMTAPKGAVSVRLAIGGENLQADVTNVRIKNVVFCPADESTAMFHGGSGANYFWTDGVNTSASVYHPPASVSITSDKSIAKPNKALAGSLYVGAQSTAHNATLDMQLFNKDGEKISEVTSGPVAETVGSLTRLTAASTGIPAKAVRARLRLSIPSVARGEYHYVDAAMIETGVSVAGSYFDGSTPDTAVFRHSWRGDAHESVSFRKEYAVGATIPPEETRTADTLRASGGRANNPYNFGFFYTFNNEVGESAASRVTVKRAQRAWSEWVWETPNALGEPSGTATNDPEKCADQLVAYMPQDVFDEAMAEGATSWSLYMFTWSNQDPAPVVALKVAERLLPPDAVYAERAWLRVTPQQADITDDAPLPTAANRENYSDPSRAGQGLVAADRMILVNDPAAAAVIRWSSNQIGEYTNFTANKGGGYKTLTSGNLYVPACVKLWQNPQSVDTLTILCMGTDGHSTSYYMAPAQVTSQSDATSFMGFEETTATQGTSSPYGVEVLNNALYHPLDDQLVKSTASNYNINHKSMTDPIANMWTDLATKYWIVSSQLDNRLYYLVNNPAGEELEPGCKGNEIWVFDAAKDSGTWSRFKIQAQSLRKIEFGHRIYMSVIRPDGVYYLDPEYALDDYVGVGLAVGARVIPWRFETNTQGANRAHDAWAHLQQVSIGLGNFLGKMEWGVKGYDVHGKAVDISKITRDDGRASTDGLMWDLEDHLAPRRDLKEWHLYGSSVDGEYSQGQISLVQYRYTPVSVNVGYEYGSVETFEYTRNALVGNNGISTNGVPVPAIDTRRP